MKMGEKADVLVIAAHPDDAEFGAAGTVARWVKEKRRVVYIICTNGDKGTSDRSLNPKELAEIREKEQRAAASVLGVREVVFLRYPDQGLEDTADFRKQIVRQIRTYRPKTIVTSDPYRRYIGHRDHRVTGQVVIDAVYPFARDHLAYPDLIDDHLAPHKVEEILFWGSEDINFHSDITDTFSLKMEALFCHKSQMAGRNRQQMETVMKERYRVMAEQQAFELAEVFHRAILPP